METISLPDASFSPDLDYAGLFYTRKYYGYRKNPYASQHTLKLGVAPHEGAKPLIAYSGTFRHLLRNLDGLLGNTPASTRFASTALETM
ncbi:MAG: hypothetical protein OXG35_07330 [Acidobacteria bacterium]|nr:hypothetical protein [Acidobacteriota bacterium]